MYRSIVSSAGYATVAVEDGAAALRQIEQEPPQVVVLDLALARISGQGVYWELKGRPRTQHIPVVVVTGTDPSGLPPDVPVLMKPVDPDLLLLAVKSAVNRAPTGT